MRIKSALEYLKKQRAPADSSDAALKAWHSQEDSIGFLVNTTGDDVPIYIGGTDFYVYSLIVPLEKLQGDYIDDLSGWNFSVSSGYGYGYSSSEQGPVPFLSEPIEHSGSQTLDGASPIFFLRSFPGYKGGHSYIEINQRICHVFAIHWIEERRAWCKLNDLGEIVPVARWETDGSMNYCTLRKEELDLFLFLTNACLVRVFDVTRSTDWETALHASLSEAQYKDEKNEIHARRILRGEPEKPTASVLRGFQIIRCSKSREQMLVKVEGKEPRLYVSFLIWDWKNKQVREWSSDPSQLGNYFVKSDLPYETSPVFFKPEVFLQYRQDPSRYTIKEREIECRGAWSLEYDINDEGQVHAYIIDLSRLPYQEQLHWKAFNEAPKAGISARAIKTDFEAQWDDSYDPLRSLKSTLESFPTTDQSGKECAVWRMPNISDTRDINFLGYVVTDSRKEWEDQVLALAQILVDGLNATYINRLAEALNCRDKKFGSGKQLATVLVKTGLTEGEVKNITKPLAELWDLRSSIVAHPGGSLPEPDLKKHFRSLLERCDLTMKAIAEFASSGRLTVP